MGIRLAAQLARPRRLFRRPPARDGLRALGSYRNTVLDEPREPDRRCDPVIAAGGEGSVADYKDFERDGSGDWLRMSRRDGQKDRQSADSEVLNMELLFYSTFWFLVAGALLPFVALVGTGLTMLFLQVVSAVAYEYL